MAAKAANHTSSAITRDESPRVQEHTSVYTRLYFEPYQSNFAHILPCYLMQNFSVW